MTAVQCGWAPVLQLTGVLDAARWTGAGSLDLPNLGTVLVQNDAVFLYVGIDAIHDVVNDPGTGDYFWLTFDADQDKAITPYGDVNYAPFAGQPNRIAEQWYLGPDRWTGVLPSAGASGCRIGFGASLTSPTAHRMFEIKIPLSDIGGSVNASPPHVFMGLRVSSQHPAITVEVPPGFTSSFSALTEVRLMKDPAAQLNQILQANPQVAAALQWQASPADLYDAYAPPTAASMVAYANWSSQQKADLLSAFQVALQWILQGAPSVPPMSDGLSDAPMNIDPGVGSDTQATLESVTPAYMWSLYVHHAAFSLVHMANGVDAGGFSLAGLSAEELRWLLSSSTMAWNIRNQFYTMGTYAVQVPVLRANNMPSTSFAPPRWVYSFLRESYLLGATRKATIALVLDWMRHNMTHFFGTPTFGTCEAVWQYRGYPPLSRIVAGTIDTNSVNWGKRHYTMGCHGSVGFLNAVLRILNIPVLPVWVCAHELAYFPTERLYLDHGDDPYNLNVSSSNASILRVLISESTYAKRFSPDPTVNIAGPGPACGHVGQAAVKFPR
jgi:hypothetical protein